MWLRLRRRVAFGIFRIRGAVAQSGERLNGIEEVGGSTPPSSTFYPSTSVPLRLRKSHIRSWDTLEPFPFAPPSSPGIPTRVW